MKQEKIQILLKSDRVQGDHVPTVISFLALPHPHHCVHAALDA
jgi:hypothetical protein